MRKAIGSLIKGFAFVFVILLVGTGIALSNQPNFLGISITFQPFEYIGLGFAGFLVFLLLFACGQFIQSIVEIPENQAAFLKELQTVSALLREQRPGGGSFFSPQPAAAPKATAGTPFTGPSSQPASASWQRSAPKPDSPYGDFFPRQDSAVSDATDNWQQPGGQPGAYPGGQPETKPAPGPLQNAPAAPSFSQIACSLCQTVQSAGRLSCIHCGAIFSDDMSV